MIFDWAEWLNLGLRWLHLTAGIAWIGSSFYFVWLDGHLMPPANGEASGELWAVHGGGFYHNQKYMVAPGTMPDDLHWFKWEAYWTWISGFSLLVLVYYVGASNFLIDPAKAALSVPVAVAIGLGALATGWLVYDGLCRSPLARNDRLLAFVWFACLVGAAAALNSVFASRAAYLHVGAMIGSVMVGNVFFVIIPNQRKVVAALIAGRQPDPALGKTAKQRSLHNNYMTLPVLFIMLSHHYPMTYGAQRPWLVLALIGATGVAIRHVFNLRHRARDTGPTMLLAVILAFATMGYVTLEKGEPAAVSAPATGAPVAWADVQPLFARHCMACHSPHPTNPAFAAPPLGVMLDSYAHARLFAPRVKQVAVDAQIMPLGNTTGMTPAERAKLGAWIAGGNIAMSTLSTHVLDTAHGKPAAGVALTLMQADGAVLFSGQTDGDGRCPGLPLLSPGTYRLSFAVADYFRSAGVVLADPPFLDIIAIDFGVAPDGDHYHVPLLVAPYAYSTYRGS